MRSLFQRLNTVYSLFSLKRILAGAAVLLGMSTATVNEVEAQAYKAPVVNPFSIAPPGSTYYTSTAVVDLDNDGDLDIVAGSFYSGFIYYQNNGTASSPAFGSPVANPFGLATVTAGGFTTLGDLDGDGDLDLISGEANYGNFVYFQNTGTASAPAFANPVNNPFGLAALYNITIPNLVDIDGNGDLDLFTGNNSNSLTFFQNTGTATAPAFTTPVTNPFGLSVNLSFPVPTFGDADGDGDFDLICGDFYRNFTYYQNTGTSTSPAFAAAMTNPFGLSQYSSGYLIFPAFADLYGDADADLLVGNFSADLVWYEDTTLVNTAPVVAAPPNDTVCASTPFGPVAFTADDIDGDSLTVWGTSSNQALVPDGNINITGTQPNFNVGATPVAGQTGTATLTLWADDGTDTTSTDFALSVDSCPPNNTAPFITPPPNDVFCLQDFWGPVAFTADDPDQDPVTVTATSSNQAVIADADITLNGTQPNYTIEAVASGQGTATITLTSDDGSLQGTGNFDLEVQLCPGIPEDIFVQRCVLFPNPTASQLHFEVELLDPAEEFRFEVKDLLGKTVRAQQVAGSRLSYAESIDVSGLAKGLYTLQFHTGVFRFSKKFVIE